jgi:hypothetical protein
MTESRSRGFHRQLLATDAARYHPETFEIYVQSAVCAVKGVRCEARVKLPSIVAEMPQQGTVCERKVTFEAHPPVLKKVDADNVPASIVRAFPHLKHRNMIFRHGEPALPLFTLEWPVTSKVDTFRRDGSPERQSRALTTQPLKSRPPKAALSSVDPQMSMLRARARNAATLRSQVRNLIGEVVKFELHKRKSITRDSDASFLKLIRRYEDLTSARKGTELQAHHDSRRLSRQLARSLCVDALSRALNVKAIEDREQNIRRVAVCQEYECRQKLWILYWRKIGFATPERNSRESLRCDEQCVRLTMKVQFIAESEQVQRSFVERDHRNSFDDIVLLRDIIASSCSIDERETVLRSYMHNDEQMERLLLHFHGAFRWISLEEVHGRLTLRKQVNEHLRAIHTRESSAIKIQSLQRRVAARKEAGKRRRECQSQSATAVGYRLATSETSTQRSMVASTFFPCSESPSRSSTLNDAVAQWSSSIEGSLSAMITRKPSDGDLESYRQKKVAFASQVDSFRVHGPNEVLSNDNRRKLRRLIILVMREPDSDTSNIVLMQSLANCCVDFGSMVVSESLLLHAIADGSCTYFDVLLQCLLSSNLTLPAENSRQAVAAALGNPTKRILLAGTILRREKVFNFFQNDMNLLWQDFFWNISSKSLLFDEVEDGLSLREPLLIMLANHATIQIRFEHVAPCNNPKSFSLLAHMCRDVHDASFVSQLLQRPKQNVQLAVHSRSGVPLLFPLAHAVVAGNTFVAEALCTLATEEEINEACIALNSALPNVQTALRDTLRCHSK